MKFLHRPKPRTYRYIPRLYDPAKEELEQRLRQHETGKGDDVEAVKARISSGLRQRSQVDTEYQSRLIRKSNRTLFYTIVLLILITFVLLSKGLPTIIHLLE